MLLLNALKAVVGRISVDEDTLIKALEDADLDQNDTYEKSAHKKKVDLCAIEVLEAYLSSADIAEGDLSIKMNLNGVKERLSLLKAKYNIAANATGPKVRIRNLW